MTRVDPIEAVVLGIRAVHKVEPLLLQSHGAKSRLLKRDDGLNGFLYMRHLVGLSFELSGDPLGPPLQ